MYLSEFVEFYGRDRDIAAVTWADYRHIVNAFEAWYGRPISLELLTGRVVTDYLCWLAAQGRSPSTIRGRRTKLLVLWRSAYEGRYTDNQPDPRIRRIKVPAPNPQGLTHEQTAALVAWCQVNMRRKMRLVPVPAGDYLAALFLFLWSTGMRLGDALTIDYSQIDQTITWRQSKTGRWNSAKLSPATLAAIEAIRTDRALVWPRPGKSRTALYRLIKRAFAGVGMVGTSKLIRQGVATDVFLAGKDPGQALGHVPGSRVAIRHYVRPDAQLSPVSPTEL